MNQDQKDITPVRRPLSASARFYSRLAPWYDWLAASEQSLLKDGVWMLNPQHGESLIDVGAGTGRGLELILQEESNGLHIGLDLSKGMCLTARQKLIQYHPNLSPDLLQGNALKIPLQSNAVDAIFCSFTLELFDTPLIPSVLDEFRRILKATGRLLLVSLSKDQPLPWTGRVYEQLHLLLPTWIDCRPIPVLSLLQASGYQVVQDKQVHLWGLPVSISLSRVR